MPLEKMSELNSDFNFPETQHKPATMASSTTSSSLGNNLHFIFIPLMAPGHLLPMVDMAKLLSQRGVAATIVTTPLNAAKIRAGIDREIESGSPIQLLQAKFPNVEAGIPEFCESIETLPSMDLRENFFIALSLWQKPLESLLETLNPFPDCIVSDKNIACVADISTKFKIPRIIFDGTSSFNLLCNHNLHTSKVYETVSDSNQFITIPGLPHRIEMRKSQLPVIFNPGPGQTKMNTLREAIREAEAQAYGIVVNSFEELEAEYFKEYQRVTGNKVWCVGPVSLSNKDDIDKANRGGKDSSDGVEKYVKWLDSWPKSSVIYVCLGSLNRVMPQQLIELGLGLEATKRPFIWVLRGAYKGDEFEEWLREEGFEERVKERGILIRGWAPQVLILSHGAIGGFLTHCGWNSTLEATCAGVPVVTFPMFADQFYNEKLAVQVLETGVRLGVESSVHFGDEDKVGGDGVQVTRENVREALEKVMGDGEETKKRRERARKYAEMAKKAIEQDGSSFRNMSMLIEDIMHVKLQNHQS